MHNLALVHIDPQAVVFCPRGARYKVAILQVKQKSEK